MQILKKTKQESYTNKIINVLKFPKKVSSFSQV